MYCKVGFLFCLFIMQPWFYPIVKFCFNAICFTRFIFVNSVIVYSIISCNNLYQDFVIVCLVFCQSKFNICARCDMAFIEPMHRNKPNVTYLGFHYNVCLVFRQLKFNICIRCNMAFVEPMHRNKPNITYLLTSYLLTYLLGMTDPVCWPLSSSW